jgi:hypothetical protein
VRDDAVLGDDDDAVADIIIGSIDVLGLAGG